MLCDGVLHFRNGCQIRVWILIDTYIRTCVNIVSNKIKGTILSSEFLIGEYKIVILVLQFCVIN